MAVYLGTNDVNLFGGQPTSAPNLQTKSESYTPTESAISDTITPDAGYDGLDEVDISISAIPSNYIGSGVTQRTSSDLSASGATVTAPSGYYASNATYTVASGTAGTPTASKGAVNNHSITVTPSVTNTAGYISGGTITGTGVSVSASELVSGTLSVTSSGTKDVTNYASASIPSGTEGTPTATKGAVNNHSISVTPSVTNTTGFITGSTKTGTAVTVTASELDSGSKSITSNGNNQDVVGYATVNVNVPNSYSAGDEGKVVSGGSLVSQTSATYTSNNTYDTTLINSVTVNVSGGGGGGSPTVATATKTLTSAASSIQFTGLSGDPTSFVVTSQANISTGGTVVAGVVYDGSNVIGQTITSQVTYDGSSFSKSYSSGTLTITSSTATFQAAEYKLVYSYDGSTSDIHTSDVQVGSGATSITFTGLSGEPMYFSCIFKSNFSTSSGYQRVIEVVNDGTNTYGMAMDSSAKAQTSWSYSYGGGSLTITSNGTNNGGYFHQPGYYQLTYLVDSSAPSLGTKTITANGTYNAEDDGYDGYSSVTVNVSGGGASTVATTSKNNSDNTATSLQFTGLSGTPIAFFVRCATQMQSSSTTYYYVSNMRYNGTNVNGNAFRMGSTRQVTVVTSGYSYTYNGGTLTLTSSGSRTTAPGSFYNGSYELTYIY